MKTTFNNRPVEIEEIEFRSDPVDCFIQKAYYLDTLADLTDDEIEELTHETDFYDEWVQHQIVD